MCLLTRVYGNCCQILGGLKNHNNCTSYTTFLNLTLWLPSVLYSYNSIVEATPLKSQQYRWQSASNLCIGDTARPGTMKSLRCWVDTLLRLGTVWSLLYTASKFCCQQWKPVIEHIVLAQSSSLVLECIYCWVRGRGNPIIFDFTVGNVCRLINDKGAQWKFKWPVDVVHFTSETDNNYLHRQKVGTDEIKYKGWETVVNN